MESKGKQPRLIVTTYTGKDKKCIPEILNRLFISDPYAEAFEIKKNVILVYSTLSSIEAYGLLRSAPPSCAAKVFYIDLVVKIDELKTLFDSVTKILLNKKIDRFYVECINRGSNVDCREIEIGIGIAMKNFAVVDFSSYNIVFINIINNYAYVSVMNKGQEKFRSTPSDKI
ncbi:RNA methyltransferase [Acidianus sp. RZ1]|uniref:RNA methyltransferase n=1 Tax=Acidianus sp. RZ1 TaxID=1540082 RepID=UPI001490A4F7|nr:RNA methyltransferase [Acidianus sp. RZ1]NON61510.1 RNA methyltransferase [Acidianus sp. RZ1]